VAEIGKTDCYTLIKARSELIKASKSMNRQYLALLGLAIVIVVFYHISYMVNDIPQEFGYPPIGGRMSTLLVILRQPGVFAVPTFLFISGSFFAYASQARGKGTRFAYKVSWENIKHVFWPYLIWSIAFYIAIYIGRDETYTIQGYIKNLIVGYPYHFIPILVFYYAIAPILVLLSKRFGLIVIVVIAIYQVFLINLIYPGILGFDLPRWMNYMALPVLKGTLAVWGIFFPMGVIFGLNMRMIMPVLKKLKWLFLVLTFTLFALTILNITSIINAPWARFLFPVAFILLVPIIKRQSIPMVRSLERIGQRVYGVYLTHLLILYLALLIIYAVAPTLLYYRILLIPGLFALALGLPLITMKSFSQSRARVLYKYVFG